MLCISRRVLVAQLCLTLDYTIRRRLQARILEWVAIPFSISGKWIIPEVLFNLWVAFLHRCKVL